MGVSEIFNLIKFILEETFGDFSLYASLSHYSLEIIWLSMMNRCCRMSLRYWKHDQHVHKANKSSRNYRPELYHFLFIVSKVNAITLTMLPPSERKWIFLLHLTKICWTQGRHLIVVWSHWKCLFRSTWLIKSWLTRSNLGTLWSERNDVLRQNNSVKAYFIQYQLYCEPLLT